jgi:hypothetical protein
MFQVDQLVTSQTERNYPAKKILRLVKQMCIQIQIFQRYANKCS